MVNAERAVPSASRWKVSATSQRTSGGVKGISYLTAILLSAWALLTGFSTCWLFSTEGYGKLTQIDVIPNSTAPASGVRTIKLVDKTGETGRCQDCLSVAARSMFISAKRYRYPARR